MNINTQLHSTYNRIGNINRKHIRRKRSGRKRRKRAYNNTDNATASIIAGKTKLNRDKKDLGLKKQEHFRKIEKK